MVATTKLGKMLSKQKYFYLLKMFGEGRPGPHGRDATDYAAVSENVNIMFFSANLC